MGKSKIPYEDKDPMQSCGHRPSERHAAFERGPSSMCPACLEEELNGLREQITAKDEALGRIRGDLPAQLKHLKEDAPCQLMARLCMIWDDVEQALKGKD